MSTIPFDIRALLLDRDGCPVAAGVDFVRPVGGGRAETVAVTRLR
ncbi:MAG TPA: hypothetical protein VKU85_19700 [bacterium]|nr:hypothetical protein [bacterium]